jgi:hypothetical protein
VEVRADPRFTLTSANRQAKRDALVRAGKRQEVGVEAVERLRKARGAIDDVLGKLQEKDDNGTTALRDTGDSLKKRLERIEDDFTGPRDIQGFSSDPNAFFSKIRLAYGQMSSSWEAPTQAQRIMLEQAEARLTELLPIVNAALTQGLTQFREQALAHGVELFPTFTALEMDN